MSQLERMQKDYRRSWETIINHYESAERESGRNRKIHPEIKGYIQWCESQGLFLMKQACALGGVIPTFSSEMVHLKFPTSGAKQMAMSMIGSNLKAYYNKKIEAVS